MDHDVFPEALPALHNFLLAALLAPTHLGVPPPEAHSARRLAVKAKVFSTHVVCCIALDYASCCLFHPYMIGTSQKIAVTAGFWCQTEPAVVMRTKCSHSLSRSDAASLKYHHICLTLYLAPTLVTSCR